MDEILNKFNNLALDNEQGIQKDIDELDCLIEQIKIHPPTDEYSWKTLVKNYKKINNMISILDAFKSTPGWHSAIEKSFENIISIIDKTNQIYIKEINFNAISDDNDLTIPPLTDFWDKQSAHDSLIHIKKLLEDSIKNTDVKEKIRQICDFEIWS